jgi:hypothetical protein
MAQMKLIQLTKKLDVVLRWRKRQLLLALCLLAAPIAVFANVMLNL